MSQNTVITDQVTLTSSETLSKFKLQTHFMDALKKTDYELGQDVDLDALIQSIQGAYAETPKPTDESWVDYFVDLIHLDHFGDILVYPTDENE